MWHYLVHRGKRSCWLDRSTLDWWKPWPTNVPSVSDCCFWDGIENYYFSQMHIQARWSLAVVFAVCSSAAFWLRYSHQYKNFMDKKIKIDLVCSWTDISFTMVVYHHCERDVRSTANKVNMANAFWILGDFLSDCTSTHFDELATRLKGCTHMSLFS